jgi:hypothetical protein
LEKKFLIKLGSKKGKKERRRDQDKLNIHIITLAEKVAERNVEKKKKLGSTMDGLTYNN